MNAQNGFLLTVKPEGEVFIEPLQVVDAGLGVNLLGVGGDEGWTDLLPSHDLLVVVLDEGTLHARHSNGNDYYIIINSCSRIHV